MGFFDYILGFDPKNMPKSKKPPLRNVSPKHTKMFHKKKHLIPTIIKGTIGKQEIVYGEHALKIRFPKYLERPTNDYDVLSRTPMKDAIQAEKALDKKFGGDFFFVKQAEHEGTFKVVAYANQEGYADFTKLEKPVKYDTIKGIKYMSLDEEIKNRKKSLQNPEFSFRHPKDKDALNRIKIYKGGK